MFTCQEANCDCLKTSDAPCNLEDCPCDGCQAMLGEMENYTSLGVESVEAPASDEGLALPTDDVIVCAKTWLVEEDAKLFTKLWITQEPNGTCREFETSSAAFGFRRRVGLTLPASRFTTTQCRLTAAGIRRKL